MQTIGERLEEARKRKGISIREAAEATKIRGDYLHKLESNSFDLNLPEIYIRGFLRNYAVYLKVNADKLIADYKSLAPNEGRLPRRDNREIYGRMDIAPAARPASVESAPPVAATDAPAPAPAPSRPSFPVSAGTGTSPIDPALLVKGGIALGLVVVLILAVVFGVRMFSNSSAKSIELKPVAQQILTLTASGPVDVQVKQEIDSQVVWRGHMEAHESRDITKRGSLLLTATALENVQIEINGKRQANPFSGYNKVLIP
jgi:transcriptional regulator with XRE-family HTH domain